MVKMYVGNTCSQRPHLVFRFLESICELSLLPGKVISHLDLTRIAPSKTEECVKPQDINMKYTYSISDWHVVGDSPNTCHTVYTVQEQHPVWIKAE
jgi:hypothetical protein